MRTRDQWKETATKTKDPLAWSACKNFRREVKREIRLAERERVMEQIQSNQNNTNCIWKSIRSCIPNKSATQKIYSKDHKIVADEFNCFFASIGENTIKKINAMAADFNYKLKETPFTPRVYPTSEQFSFSVVECNQVETIVKSMASNKAPGIDKIPIRVIKDCLPAILPSIKSIINTSLLTASFPST